MESPDEFYPNPDLYVGGEPLWYVRSLAVYDIHPSILPGFYLVDVALYVTPCGAAVGVEYLFSEN